MLKISIPGGKLIVPAHNWAMPDRHAPGHQPMKTPGPDQDSV